MKVIETEHRLRLVDFPFFTALFVVFLFASFGWGFIEKLLHHASLGVCAVILLGLLITAVAGAFLIQRSEFVFDAQQKKVTWNRRSIFRSQNGVIPFDRIAFAVVQAGFIRTDSGSITGYRIALVTREGEVPLKTGFGGSEILFAGQGSDERCRGIRSKINKILDIHLTSEDANDILQMVRDGRRREAQAMAKERYRLKSKEAAEMVAKLSEEAKE